MVQGFLSLSTAVYDDNSHMEGRTTVKMSCWPWGTILMLVQRLDVPSIFAAPKMILWNDGRMWDRIDKNIGSNFKEGGKCYLFPSTLSKNAIG